MLKGQSEATISNIRKISSTQGGFTGSLDTGDRFGFVEAIGDIDGDGVEDMAVGAPWDDDGGVDYGAVWILFMNSDRTVKSQQKISATEGNFTGTLSGSDRFGLDIASLDDFDNDGVPDIAVGANVDYDGGTNSGAVWMLFLNSNGTVKSYQKISASQGGLVGLTASRQFGYSITSLGDLDGDGITDIAVGSPTYDNDGGLYKGCVWMLFLNANGTVKSQQKINDYQGGFTGILDDEDRFGLSLENIGDINKDGIVDLAVNAPNDDDGADNGGAMYLLFLNTDGTVKHTQKISALEGNFTGTISEGDHFGNSIANLGDIDGDGNNDLLTSSYLSDLGGTDQGEIWILYLTEEGKIKDYQSINSLSSPFTGMIDNGDNLGESVAVFKNLNENGRKEILIGAKNDDDGTTDAGAVYVLDLDVKHQPIANAGNDLSLCSGSTTVINGYKSTVIDNDLLSYHWECSSFQINNKDAAGLSFMAPEVSNPTFYDFILTVTCQGIISKADTITITVNSRPSTPSITKSEETYFANASGQYQWFYNGDSIIGATSQSYQPVNEGEYSVIITNEFGCSSLQSETVIYIAKPIAVATGPISVCSGTTIYLSGISSYVNNASNTHFTYRWSSDDIVIPIDTLSEFSLDAPYVSKITQINLILKVFNNTLSSDNDTLSIIIYPSPEKPTIEQFGDTLLSSSAKYYQWIREGIEISGQNDSTLVINQNGFYQVQVMNDFGCASDLSIPCSVIYSKINILSSSVKVYPNPSSSIVNITGLFSSEKIDIFIIDQNGRICLHTNSKDGTAQIDLSNLDKGLYYIEFENGIKQSIKILRK